jgi:membrane fusion protein (multidrug efflux system)
MLTTRFPSIALAACFLLVALAADAQDGLRVETSRVDRAELVNEVPLSGTVSSPRIALLSSEVAGLISALHVDAGDRVAAGDLLLELDPELSEISLQQAQATATQAREELFDTQRRLNELKTLADQNNVAATQVRDLEAQVRIDEAALQAAEAQVRRREAELRRHRITAPFEGTVSRKLAEVGEWLSPGAEVIELVGTEDLRLDFQVPQRFYPDINENTRLAVHFDAHPEQRFAARVHRKVPLTNSAARSFLLRARLEEASPALIPGMSASASLQLAVNRRGISVPRDALLRYPDGRISVWVITDRNANDRANVREQQVKTGLTFADQVEIVSGLEVGDEVVTRGNEALREGQAVQIVSGGE